MMDREAARRIAREPGAAEREVARLRVELEHAENTIAHTRGELDGCRLANRLLREILGEVALQRETARNWAVRLESELATRNEIVKVTFELLPPGLKSAKLTPEMAEELRRMAAETEDPE